MAALLVNLETIRTFPSWFDEAFFANISANLAWGHGPVLDLIPGYLEGEVLVYGPVYFQLQAWLIGLFGLHGFVFRLPNLVAAYVAVALLALYLRNNGLPRRYLLAFAAAAVVDVSFNRNLVSGRMDMVALCLVCAALHVADSARRHSARAQLVRWSMVGALSAAAFLTTPRALFLLPVVLVAGVRHLLRERAAAHRQQDALAALAAAAAFLLPVAAWIVHVGGPRAYIALFSANQTTAAHIAPSFFRSAYDNIAIALLLALAVLGARKLLKDGLLAGLLATYLAFSLFVREVGPYAGMIMPFILAAVVVMVWRSGFGPAPRAALIAAVVVPGSLLLGLRGADAFLNTACRDGSAAARAAGELAGAGATVVAPFKYYFLLESKERHLLTFEYSKRDPAQILAAADVVVSDRAMGETLAAAGFSKAADFRCDSRRVPLLPESFYRRSTFEEALYRRSR